MCIHQRTCTECCALVYSTKNRSTYHIMGFTSTISSLRGWHFYATNPLKISPVLLLSVTCTDMQPSPLPAEEDRPVGMEALEALHNQIQILVKKNFHQCWHSCCTTWKNHGLHCIIIGEAGLPRRGHGAGQSPRCCHRLTQTSAAGHAADSRLPASE